MPTTDKPRIYFVTRETLIEAFRKMEEADRADGLGDNYADEQAEADSLIAFLPEHLHPYTVGDLTRVQVFNAAGITNLSDMQAVLDAVEAALERLCFGEEAKGLNAAAAEGGAS